MVCALNISIQITSAAHRNRALLGEECPRLLECDQGAHSPGPNPDWQRPGIRGAIRVKAVLRRA